MRRPLIATTLLLALAVLGTVAFVHTLDTSRALADDAPRPGGSGGSGGPGGPPGGPGGPPGGGPPGMGGPPGGGPGGMGGPPPPFDTSMAHADTMVAEMIRHLGPKANMPAESAYKNIQILKGMPASNVPKIMVYGFSRGLGVRCGECHARGDFSSDEKGNKKTARAMWKMAWDINHTYLANMKDLEDEAPFVNCWTCHRGHAKPENNATH